MNVIRKPAELSGPRRNVCVAIGMFDGVHLGHQQVLRQTITDAEQDEAQSVAITFDRHPNSIVAPDRVPPLIYSLPQKLRAIDSVGVDATLLLQFGKVFSRQTGEEFVRSLARDFAGIQSVCVGSDFTFGYNRSGNVPLLRRLGEELGFVVHGLAALSLDGKAVSSTRIREAIRSGELDAASQMLGRAYALAGGVVRGDQLGQELGFPTANLDVTGLIVPPSGVYAVHVHLEGRSYRGVLNIGYRPTLRNPAPQLRVEAHLLDFQGDLYTQELEMTFVRKLREEIRFPSLDALRSQIERDVIQARGVFGTGAG